MLGKFVNIAVRVGNRLHREVIKAIARIAPARRFNSTRNEQYRLETLPRYTELDTLLDGRQIRAHDSGSYMAMYREIMDQEIYKFRASSDDPYIVDCGANIGISIMYFKKLYPAARVVAFEPDSHTFELLEYNMREFGFANVTVIQKGVWSDEGVVGFIPDMAEGWGGSIQPEGSGVRSNQISVTRLRSYLVEEVDMLKLDIEGAECEVIADCADLLGNVKNIFIEYHSFVDRSQCLGRIISILTDAGFRINLHSGGAYSRNPFINLASLSNGMDMQLYIFGVRIPKAGECYSMIEQVNSFEEPVPVR